LDSPSRKSSFAHTTTLSFTTTGDIENARGGPTFFLHRKTPSLSSITQGCNGISNQPADVDRAGSVLFPPPAKHEQSSSTKWFETTYVRQVHLEAFCQQAHRARGDPDRSCSFGERRMGGLNVAITLRFDDGIEWIIKTPRLINEASLERLESEAATLLLLEKVGFLPTPRLHAYSLTAENTARTLYIIMNKIPGVTLGEAIYLGLGREGVYRTLEGLATFRKPSSYIHFPAPDPFSPTRQRTTSERRVLQSTLPKWSPISSHISTTYGLRG